MNKTKIILMVAFDCKKGIARKNEIPWGIKEDYTFFQDVSKRDYHKGKLNACIMGKATWKAIPEQQRGLKDRITIVISTTMTQEELEIDNTTKTHVYLVRSLEGALELCQNLDLGCILICGGNGIYKQALEELNVDEIYLTDIYDDYECDVFFPYDSFLQISNNYQIFDTKTFLLKDTKHDRIVNTRFIKYVHNDDYYKRMKNVNKEEKHYLDLLYDILQNGDFRQTRNAKTWSLFGKTLEFNLSEGFPLLTTKRMFFRGVFEELLFFLKGDTNSKHLEEKGINIWKQNTSRDFLDKMNLQHYDIGDMGPLYSFQLVHYGETYQGMNKQYKGFNQLDYCLNLLKNDPSSRRIIMTTFHAIQAMESVLYPCHGLFIQFYVEKDNKLSCMMTQRSSDSYLGLSFNITSYSLLVHMFCEVINNDQEYKGNKLNPGRLIMNLGDTHIYHDHYSESIRQILREPYTKPILKFKRKISELTDFKFEDIELINYQCYPNIPVKMVA